MTEKNFWFNSGSEKSAHGRLDSDTACEVLVIGGGISGVLTAYFLSQSGVDVVLADASRILSGQTACTTAKITSQHGAKLSRIASNFSTKTALEYLNANENAVSRYEKLIVDNHISCAFERLPSYLYSVKSDSILQKEYAIASRSSVAVSLCRHTSLPFDVVSALKFDNQAQFNPIAFLSHLTKNLRIYENTRITRVEDTTAYCDKLKIRAKKVVFATHYPIVNFPGYYFMRMHQSRSYVVVLKNADELGAMYYSADKGGLSFRNYNGLMLLSSCSHRTGESIPHAEPYKYLEQKGKEFYPDSSVVFRYSAQDCMTADLIPYAGQYSPSKPNWYVLTGYSKWGMTNAMVCAELVTNMILNIDDPLRKLYDPHRFNTSCVKPVLKEVSHAASGLVKSVFGIPINSISDIPYGGAKIVEYKGKRRAVYKSEQGEIFSISPRCSHLGCRLQWNSAEKTWDCPCHGSRFSYTGELIDSPAQCSLNAEIK